MMSGDTFKGLAPLPTWVITGIASALVCSLPYKISPRITPAFSQEYVRLKPTDRLDWDSRYASTLHAVSITALSAFLLLLSDVFREEEDMEAKGSVPLMLRTSPLTDAALGVSLGYFVVDIGIVAWHCPLLGGPEMVIHHTAALASALTAAALGQGHMYTLLLLSTECTTPFLNARWWLDKLGMRFSGAYTVNGVCMTVTWFVGRILLFLWFFAHMWSHRAQLSLLAPPALVLVLLVPPLLFGLNVWWFGKILRGIAKLLSGTLSKDDNLGFRLQAEAYLKRKAQQESGQATTGPPASPKPCRRPQVLHGERGDTKETLRHRDGAENFIANVTTGAEPPRHKRRNSLLSG